MAENLKPNQVIEFRKVKHCTDYYSKLGSQEICVWGVEYKYNEEWYDLFEDPPEWIIDIIVKVLNEHTLGHKVKAIWSEEDQEFIGLCDNFPSLSFMSPSHVEALEGIIKLVREIDE